MSPEVKYKTFEYEVSSRTLSDKTGEVSAAGIPEVRVSAPVEFKGEAGNWTPEHLFVSSLAACVLVRFLGYGKREGLEFESYSCRVVGKMARQEIGWVMDDIEMHARVEVKGAEMVKKASEVLSLAEENCPISNSIRAKVILEKEIVDLAR